MRSEGQTVIVSNRLPWKDETDRTKPSCQRPYYIGLSRTLDSVLRSSGGTWIGCSHGGNKDNVAEMAKDWNEKSNYSIAPVLLSMDERTAHQRFSNAVTWPLLHGHVSQCSSAADSWSGYCKVNGRFAETILTVARPEDFVWVHDYPLMMVASLLRANGWHRRIGYFHHTPFPHPSIVQTLPSHVELLHGLLQFDLIGFQRDDDRRNFVACLLEFLPLPRPVEIDSKFVLHILNRETRVGVYPTGIDYQAFPREASRTGVLAAANGIISCVRGTRIVLSVGQLDPTTGIYESLAAFQRLLERNPELRGRVTMIQIAVPFNERISDCRVLEIQIETIVDQINLRFGNPDWIPVHYYHRQLTESQMIAFYRSADVALIAPLRDGISLAAKEFCACKMDGQGVLILSEFTGAAEELRGGAVLVNPYDPDDVARGLQMALRMSVSEQEERMTALRSRIRANNVFNWSQTFQNDANLLNPASQLRQMSQESVRARLRSRTTISN